MKTVVKMILPVAAFMLASAGAVSTNKADDGNSSKLVMTGYLHKPSIPCDAIEVNCQVQNNGQACEAGGQNVYRLTSPGFCPNLLWKVIP